MPSVVILTHSCQQATSPASCHTSTYINSTMVDLCDNPCYDCRPTFVQVHMLLRSPCSGIRSSSQVKDSCYTHQIALQCLLITIIVDSRSVLTMRVDTGPRLDGSTRNNSSPYEAPIGNHERDQPAAEVGLTEDQ